LVGPSPIFSEAKKRKFYNGANGHVLLCDVNISVNSERLANGDQRNYLGYLSHRWFSIMHVLVSGGPSLIFTGGKNGNFGQHFRQDSNLVAYCFTKGGIWEIKNNIVNR